MTRITFAEQEHIDAIPKLIIDEFLRDIFQRESALVTDESTICDFVPFSSFPMTTEDRAEDTKAACIRIFEIYGVNCVADDYLWQVIERIIYANRPRA